MIGTYALKCDHVFAIYGSAMHFECGATIDVLTSTEDEVLIDFGNVHPCGWCCAWHPISILDSLEKVL